MDVLANVAYKMSVMQRNHIQYLPCRCIHSICHRLGCYAEIKFTIGTVYICVPIVLYQNDHNFRMHNRDLMRSARARGGGQAGLSGLTAVHLQVG